MNRNPTLKIVVAALLGAAWAQAQAAEPDFDNWQCKFCPFPESGTTGSASAGAISVSDDSAKFGDYTGLDEEGVYADVDADVLYRGEGGYAVRARARDLGLDSRELEVEAGHQGTWTLGLSYDEIPRRLDDTTESVFSGAGTSRLALPAGWVRAGSTAGLNALDGSLRPLDLGYDVETLGVDLEFVQSQRLRYEVDYTRQVKEGFGVTWGSFLGTSAALADPIDYQTDQVDAAVVYAGDGWMLKAAYYGSFFSNKDLSLAWENPFSGPERGRMANSPDNKYNQFLLSGSFGLDFWDTKVNASYATGRMEQSDALLSYTVNPDIASIAVPMQGFDGKVDTMHANLRVVSRPTRKLRLTAEYRLDERDNQSSRNTWSIVQADSFPSLVAENPLYGYQGTDTGLAFDYVVWDGLQVYGGWDRDKTERDEQNVAETEEDTLWGKVRVRPGGGVSFSLKAEDADRDASEYRQLPAGAGQAQNPLLRKYYLADREREAYEAQLEWGGERASLSVKYMTASDDYTDSLVGLTGTDYDQWALDGSWVVGKGLVASLFYSRENYDSDLVGAGSGTAPNTAPPNWRAASADRQDMVGLALDWPGLADGRLDLRADWTWADTTGDIAVSNTLDGPKSAFPTLRGRINSAGLKGIYHYSPKVEIAVGYRLESFDASDWAIEGVEPGTIANVLTFGAEPQDYDLLVMSVGFTYKFGVKDEAEE